MKKIRAWIALALAVILLLPQGKTYSKANAESKGIELNELEEAPQNPEFNEDYESGVFIEEPFTIQKKAENLFQHRFSTFRSTGFNSLPETFDLRDESRVTPVKDQGPNGSCWAFASYGSAESILRPDRDMDFSEKNLRNLHGYDWKPEQGGNRSLSAGYLSRWAGPVDEKDDPYDTYGYDSPKNLPISMEVDKILYIPDKKDGYDTETIKRAIKDYGGVYTVISAKEKYLNQRTMGHYQKDRTNPDHAITLIGWDDNYDKRNFRVQPPTDGAWIAKNSWGPRWGNQGGYYYISYHDYNVGTLNASFFLRNHEENKEIWQHDPLGMTSQVGFGEESWFSNVFGPAKEDIDLVEVGFFVPSHNAKYEIYVNNNLNDNNSLSDKIKVTEGYLDYAGYHTVRIPAQKILKGQFFAPIIKLTTPNYKYPIAIEKPIKNYSSKAIAEKNQSYVSKDGEEWADITEKHKNTNVCLKAFTLPSNQEVDPSKVKVEKIDLSPKTIELKIDEEIQVQAKVLPENASNKELIWYSTNENIASVKDGLVQTKGYGLARIVARSTDGSYVKSEIPIRVTDEDIEYKGTLVPERFHYKQGETVRVNVDIYDLKNRRIPNKEFSIKVVNSHGEVVVLDGKTDDKGKASLPMLIHDQAVTGRYEITLMVNKIGLSKNIFNVVNGEFVPIQEDPILLDVDMERTTLLPGKDLRINVMAKDKQNNIVRYATINGSLEKPDGEKIEQSIYTNALGSVSFYYDENIFQTEGDYIFRVQGKYGPRTSTIEERVIKVDSTIEDLKSLDVSIETDQSKYLVGDRVNIRSYVRSNGLPVEDVSLKVVVVDPLNREFTTRLSTNSEGLASFNISTSTLTKTGAYQIFVFAEKEGYMIRENKTSFDLKRHGKYIDASFDSSKTRYSMYETAYVFLTVKDEKGEPIRNAEVELEIEGPASIKSKVKKTTDYYGMTSLYLSPNSNIGEGEYRIQALISSYGYPLTLAKYKIAFGELPEESMNMSLEIEGKHEVTYPNLPEVIIKAKDEWNNPLIDTSINLILQSETGKTTIERVYTDQDGVSKWKPKNSLIPGNYNLTIEASKAGYKEIAEDLILHVLPPEGAKDLFGEVKFSKEKYLEEDLVSFDVIALSGEDLIEDVNVQIDLESLDGIQSLGQGKTGADGCFTFKFPEKLKPGNYKILLTLDKDGYKVVKTSQSFHVFSALEEKEKVHISLEQNKVQVKKGDIIEIYTEVLDDNQEPLVMKNLKYTITDPRGRKAVFHRSTDRKGQHTLRIQIEEGSLYGLYRVECDLQESNYEKNEKQIQYEVISSSGVQQNRIVMNFEIEQSHFLLEDKVPMWVKTVDRNGKVLENTDLEIQISRPDGKVIKTKAKTNSEGILEFSITGKFHVVEGEYKALVKASHEGYLMDQLEKKYYVGEEIPELPDQPEEPDQPVEPELPDQPEEEQLEDRLTPDDPQASQLERQEILYKDRQVKGFFDKTANPEKIKAVYGRNVNRYALFDEKNKRYFVEELTDKVRPTVVIFGLANDEISKEQWSAMARVDRSSFNLIYALHRGGNRELESIHEQVDFSTMKNRVFRNGGVISNLLVPPEVPLAVILDREGNITEARVNFSPEEIKQVVAEIGQSLSVQKRAEANQLATQVTDITKEDGKEFKIQSLSKTGEEVSAVNYQVILRKPSGEMKELKVDTDQDLLKISAEDLQDRGKYQINIKADKWGYESDEQEKTFIIGEKEEMVVRTFDQRQKLGEFDHLSDLRKSELRIQYARSLNDYMVYDEKNRSSKLGELTDGLRPTLLVFGQEENEASQDFWRAMESQDRRAYNLIFLTNRGDLADVQRAYYELGIGANLGHLYGNGIIISNLLVAREGPFVIMLDANGRIINAYEKGDVGEVHRIFNLSFASKPSF